MSTDTIEAIDLNSLPTVSIPDEPDAPGSISCATCGKDISAQWSGRGRKPKYCDEHKGTRSSGATSLGTGRGSGDVKQAVQSLENLYQMLGVALVMVGAHESAAALAVSVPSLSMQNAQYLATDKKLVASINKIGTVGGRTGFFLANALVVGPVAIGAYREVAEKMDARARARDEAEPVG